MSAPGLLPAFRVWAKTVEEPALLVVDPGGTTGLLRVCDADWLTSSWGTVWSVKLDDLPRELAQHHCRIDAIVCEDYSLSPKRRNDPKMPASQGIGICRMHAYMLGVPLFLLQPNVKTEGRRHLDAAGLAARAACRNDHQRDVVDLAGKALYELRKARR